MTDPTRKLSQRDEALLIKRRPPVTQPRSSMGEPFEPQGKARPEGRGRAAGGLTWLERIWMLALLLVSIGAAALAVHFMEQAFGK